ncbi:MAG: hypothetical protein U1F43_26095 [Myxococcota bacterium]
MKRINGGDYPRADISIGDAIHVDLNGDDKLDTVVLASSMDSEGEGHSAGGGAFFADGRNPAHFVELSSEGQMTDIDVVALSDLDGNGRREVLLKMDCPTGTGFYLGQLSADGVQELGSVEDEGFMGSGFRASMKHVLPFRAVPSARLASDGLAAFAGLFGVPVDAAPAALEQRFGAPRQGALRPLRVRRRRRLQVRARGELRAAEGTRQPRQPGRPVARVDAGRGAKALGAPDPGGDAAAAEVRFAGGKIVATFDGDRLAKLSVDKDGLAALKKPGLFASLAEPMAKAVARWGAADETHASGAGEAASWAVPSKLLPVFTLTLECDAAACTRMAVAFE